MMGVWLGEKKTDPQWELSVVSRPASLGSSHSAEVGNTYSKPGWPCHLIAL